MDEDWFDDDQQEALEKLERLWIAYEKASATASRFVGSIGWKTNSGVEYLTHTVNRRYEGNRQSTRSLGPRSEVTERRKADFETGRERAKAELDRIQERLDTHARVLKALRIGRIPATTARFLRELRAEGFGAEHFRIGGEAALAAYEVRARTRMPISNEHMADFDLLPTELFVRDRQLFDAIAARKIFGPVEEKDNRLLFGRGITLRLLSDDAVEGWLRDLHELGAEEWDFEALRWALELPGGIPLLAVGLDGTPAPVPALDPRAFALLSIIEFHYLSHHSVGERLLAQSAASARIAAKIVPEPFEPRHIHYYLPIADALGGDAHAGDRMLMRP